MGKNFYNLVNDYRVEEVKRRLEDPQYKHLTILAIAYDSGFNAKSSFNTIFKEKTGSTPSEYLKSVHARNS
jgi:AraC-like DNA-binding protein